MKSVTLTFQCKGHANVLATHRNTLEFTKDLHLTPKGDCIIGVSADFDSHALEKLLSFSKAKVLLEVGAVSDSFEAEIHSQFCSSGEIVFRTTDFLSDRTLGVRSSKAACDLDRVLVEKLKDPQNILTVTIECFM